MSHPRYSFLVLLVAAAGLAAGCAGTRMSAPGEMRGGMMTDSYSHATLYTFDRDSANPPSSACNDYCAVLWPPFSPAAGERAGGDFTIFKRADGTSQWAYKGKPLYYYSKDAKTGDRMGDGLNGVWHVVK